MKREELIDEIKNKFQKDIISVFDKSKKRVYIDIKPEAIVAVARYMFNEAHARFNIATGIDNRHDLEILYHFTLEDINLLVSIRVKLDKKNPKIDSLTKVFKAADWIEREIHELLGIDFSGHPDLRRLLLSDDWPQGVYPLRQDYQEWDKDAIRNRGI